MPQNLELHIDEIRKVATTKLDPTRRSTLGQFMTPSTIADFMASLFEEFPSHARLLDPGAGVGSLTDAFVRRFKKKCPKGAHLSIAAYEIEPVLAGYLSSFLQQIEKEGVPQGVEISSEVIQRDFI